MKIKALITLITKDEEHAPNAVLDLPEKDAQSLVARGFAVSTEGRTALTKATPTIDDIVDAIDALDEKDFGKDGKPNVKSIEQLLDVNITAAQRDAAWEAFQDARGAENDV